MPFWEDIPPEPRVGHALCGTEADCPFCNTPILYARLANKSKTPGRVVVFCKPDHPSAVRGYSYLVREGVAAYWGHAGGEWALHRCEPQTEAIEKMKSEYVTFTAAQYRHLNINAPARGPDAEPVDFGALLERKRRDDSAGFYMERTGL